MSVSRWIQVRGKIRPWMVAVALACGGGAGCSSTPPTTTEPEPNPPPPADASTEPVVGEPCEMPAVYGPMPCTTDEQCVEQQGEGWVCGAEPMMITDSCGNQHEYGRLCEPGSDSTP